jgi:hypothetical protein
MPNAESALLTVLTGEYLSIFGEFFERLPQLSDSQFKHGPR